jgi:hypothetical protein
MSFPVEHRPLDLSIILILSTFDTHERTRQIIDIVTKLLSSGVRGMRVGF